MDIFELTKLKNEYTSLRDLVFKLIFIDNNDVSQFVCWFTGATDEERKNRDYTDTEYQILRVFVEVFGYEEFSNDLFYVLECKRIKNKVINYENIDDGIPF